MAHRCKCPSPRTEPVLNAYGEEIAAQCRTCHGAIDARCPFCQRKFGTGMRDHVKRCQQREVTQAQAEEAERSRAAR